MDGNDFDSLTRKLGGLASRRQALAGLVGAAVAATGLSAAAKNKGKSKKGKAHGFSAKDIRKGKGILAAACGNIGCLGCSDGTIPNPDQSCNTGTPVCVPGNQDNQCGRGGAICTACNVGIGEICVNEQDGNGGVCAVPPVQCFTGPLSNNCIQANGSTITCQNAAGPNACGFTANGSCLPACAANQECIEDFGPTTFSCTSATCSTTCPNGCCASATDPINPPGSCQPGDNIVACGKPGKVCTDCLLVCGLNGSCVNGVCSCNACGAVNQPCCTGTGVTPCNGTLVCNNGTCEQPAACGAANQPCCAGNVCNGSLVCNNNLCEAKECNPTNCAAGCCQGTTCVTAISDAQCGINGSVCVACQGKKKCKNGVCKKKHHHKH
jgi:hypothetical protein